jgi:hypothetical protein
VNVTKTPTAPPVDLNNRQALIAFLKMVPKSRAVCLAARSAQRVAPCILKDHPEDLERLNIVEAVLRVVFCWVQGAEVSLLTQRLVRDLAYDVADVCPAAAPALYAAAAIVDADPSRAVAAAILETLKHKWNDTRKGIEHDLTRLALEDEFGPLWPDGEPEWSRTAWATWQAKRHTLISLLELPKPV